MGAISMPLTLIATTGLENEDQGSPRVSSTRRSRSEARSGSRSCRRSPQSHTNGHSAAALVNGFHYAFIGAAVLVGLSLIVFVALLRKRDVARIEADIETEPALAA